MCRFVKSVGVLRSEQQRATNHICDDGWTIGAPFCPATKSRYRVGSTSREQITLTVPFFSPTNAPPASSLPRPGMSLPNCPHLNSQKRFSVNGQPYQMLHCDYLGGKGIGLARLYTPAGAVDLYISHLHADYSCNTTSPTSGSKDRCGREERGKG